MRSTNEDNKWSTIVLIATWIVLIALTIGSSWISDSSGVTASIATKVALGAALLKGHLIAGVFMEMRRGPIVWAVAMSGFLVFQAILLIMLLP